MFGQLKTLGVRIRRVEDLAEGSLYSPEHQILFLDDNLTDAEIEDIISQILPAAVAVA